MARFILMSGKDHFGLKKTGTRQVIKAGDEFEAVSEKHAEFCRKYPDRYQEVKGGFARPVSNTLPAPVKPVPIKKVETKSAEPETVEIDVDNLDKMDLRELLVLCRKAGIDTKGAVRKEDIVKAIKAEVNKGE